MALDEVVSVRKEWMQLVSISLDAFNDPKFREQVRVVEMSGSVSDYSESPEPTRLDDLNSFGIIAWDLLKANKKDMVVGEVNGSNGGMDGFSKAGVRLETIPTQMYFPGSELYASMEKRAKALELIRNPCQEMLRAHLYTYGENQVALIAAFLNAANINRFRFSDWVFDFLTNFKQENINPDWFENYQEIAETVIGIEQILTDKLQANSYFDGMRSFKPRTAMYTEDSQRELEESGADLMIVKPRFGLHGSNIQIIEPGRKQHHPMGNYYPFGERPEYVIEPFIESELIESKSTGQKHVGSMRYMTLIEEDKKGDVTVFHFGGYWRLAPKPFDGSQSVNVRTANLSKGAICEPASSEDLELAKNVVDLYGPEFYKNMVKGIRE